MSTVEQRRASRKAEPADRLDRVRPAILVLLLAIAFGSVIAFGAVDAWANGLLAVGASAVIVLWAADAWRTGQFEIDINSLYFPLVGLIVLGCVQLLPLGGDATVQDAVGVKLSSALSLDPYATRVFTIRLIVLLVFFAAAFTFVDSKRKLTNCAMAVIIFSAAMAFFGILQRLSGTESIYGSRPSPQAIFFGPFVNQHHFAAFMELSSGLALGMLFGRGASRERRIILGLGAMIMGIAVVFTGSRGGIISYGGVILVAGVLSVLKSRDSDRGEGGTGRMAAFAGGAALFVGVLATGFFLGGGDALFRGLAPGSTDITSGRTHFWSVAWRIFLDHPLIGAGHEAFGVAFTRYDAWNGAYRVEQAHNDYLQMLADGGLIGFACVAAFIYFLARQSLRVIANVGDGTRANIATGALAGCTGILIHSIFDFPLRTTSNAVLFLLLVVFACARVERDGRRLKSRRRGSGAGHVSEP